MSLSKELTIDDYVDQGHSRIQAIKLFYESALKSSGNVEKTYQGADFENGIVRSKVAKFNELGRVKVIEIQREGRVWRMPEGSRVEDFERLKQEGVASLAPTAEEELAEQQRALSEGREWMPPIVLHAEDDGSFAEDKKSVRSAAEDELPISYEKMRQSLNLGGTRSRSGTLSSLREKEKESNTPPPTGTTRTLNLAPLSQVHSSLFQHTNNAGAANDDNDEEEEENNALSQQSEDEESLGGREPVEENINRFLSFARYNADELREFYFCVESGLDVDQASDMILQRRIHLFAQQGIDFIKEVRSGRLPLRHSLFTGNRSDDLEMLLERRYQLATANHILDLVYARKFGIPLKDKSNIVPRQSTVISSDRLSFGGSSSIPGSSKKNNNSDNSEKQKSSSSLSGTEGDAPRPAWGKMSIPPPIVIPSAASQTQPQSVREEENALETRQWYKGFNFDAKRGMLRAALNMSSAYDDSEHEVLRISLLISQQEAQHGVNMYDALLPTDEPKVEELVSKGLTLDEAVLTIFETRFGRTKPVSPNTADMLAQVQRKEQQQQQQRERQQRSSESVHSPSPTHSLAHSQSEKPISYAAMDSLEAEIALLMSAGYSRDKAVKILLERKRLESAAQVAVGESVPVPPMTRTPTHSGGSSPSPSRPTQPTQTLTRTSSTGTPRSLSQQALLRSASQSAHAHSPPPAQMLQRQPSQQTQHTQHTQQAPAYAHHHTHPHNARVHTHPHHISRAHNEEEDDISRVTDPTMVVPPVHMLDAQGLPVHPRAHLHPHPQMLYAHPHIHPNGHPQPLMGVNALGQVVPIGAYPPQNRSSPHAKSTQPSPLAGVLLPAQINATRPVQRHIYNRQEERTLHGISPDERALRIGLLVSQQEAAFGCNMYDSFSGSQDEAEAEVLRAAGYNDDEAALIIFEKKFGPPGADRRPKTPRGSIYAQQPTVALPPPVSTASPQFSTHSSLRPKAFTPRSSVSGPVSSPVPVPVPGNLPGTYASPPPPGYAASPRVSVHTPHAQHTQQHTQAAQQQLQDRESLELAQALEISKKETHSRPGAVRVSGVGMSSTPQTPHNASNTNAVSFISAEVSLLMNMGFSQEQSILALRNQNGDVQRAADYLLGGS